MEKSITYEQFTSEHDGKKIYYQFSHYFRRDSVISGVVCNMGFYREFIEGHPDLSDRLMRCISESRYKDVSGCMAGLEPELYSAYIIMMELGATSEELLSPGRLAHIVT